MSPKSVYLLKQPTKNRGLSFEDLKNGKVIINNITFESFRDAEDYLIDIPRTDI